MPGWGPQIKDAQGNVIYWPIKSGGSVLVGRNGALTVESSARSYTSDSTRLHFPRLEDRCLTLSSHNGRLC